MLAVYILNGIAIAGFVVAFVAHLYVWRLDRKIKRLREELESRVLATEYKVKRWTKQSTTHDMPAVRIDPRREPEE